MPATFDHQAAESAVAKAWDGHVLDTLHEFVRIPNQSPAFDPDWAEAGHMERAVDLVQRWCEQQVAAGLDGARVEVQRIDGLTPLLLVDIPASPGAGIGDDDTVLLYGHLDKQPPFEGWRDGLGPWTPVVEGQRLYGRGGADDGYAAFAALTALAALRRAGGAHARCVLLVEASEESGSPDLPAHLEQLGDHLGNPSLVVALDSGCEDWDHLWVTTSLRGMVVATVTVSVLTEGIHSGTSGGAVPSSFRVLRQLLDRIEDPSTGRLTIPEMHVDMPALRVQQMTETAEVLGDITDRWPLAGNTTPTSTRTDELLRAATWQPALEVVGLDGAPPPRSAGNVLRPSTTAKLSIRIPPTADAEAAAKALVERLTTDVPYGADVEVELENAEAGWHAPEEADWLRAGLDRAATAAFGQPYRVRGEGGSIPFMAMLGQAFPDAQFVVTGVLGPGANAHGPNEFLDLPTARRVTTAVAHLLHAHATR